MHAELKTSAAERHSAATALIAYLAISVGCFGWPILADFAGSTVGDSGPDPTAFTWFLAWWPYAILHGLNPFLTRLVWAPTGVNLAWAGSVPAAALLVAPITLTVGPVVAFNVLSLAAPALAAWTAFLLCRYLTHSFWPALAGGYFFGFSSYELGQLRGHLAIDLIFLLPLIVLLVLLFYEMRLNRIVFVVSMALVLTAQFGFSTEIFATSTFWGTMAFGIALAVGNREQRKRVVRLAGYIGVAYALAGAMLAPYLYYIFRGLPELPRFINSPIAFSADLLNYIVPTRITLLGGDAFAQLSSRFSGNESEQGAYLGLPLLLILFVYAANHWSSQRTRGLALTAASVAVGSFGPILHVAGIAVLPMPWLAALWLPLIKHALPTRFTLYIALIAAIVVALWLTEDQGKPWRKWSAVALAAMFLLPNLGAPGWFARRDIPPFFQSNSFQRLDRDENVIVIPYGDQGDSMLWQAITGMWFRMSGGYVGLTPQPFSGQLVTDMLYSGVAIPKYRRCFLSFFAAHDVRAVVVARDSSQRWAWLSSLLGAPGIQEGRVTVYAVPPTVLLGHQRNSLCEQFAVAQFRDLLQAAQEYLARGGRLPELTPASAERMGVLAPVYGGYAADSPNRNWTLFSGWLGAWGAGYVAVGVVGSSNEIRPIVERYRGVATAIYFPYPKPLTNKPPRSRGQFFAIFRAEQWRK